MINERRNLRAPLKTVLFPDGGVSGVLKSSCIGPYTAVFRVPLPCPQKKSSVFRGAFKRLSKKTERPKNLFFEESAGCLKFISESLWRKNLKALSKDDPKKMLDQIGKVLAKDSC